MRFQKLDLRCFGRFSGTEITFPSATADFHIIYGPNEAGKTTSLVAIEDVLYGIPSRSPYGFLHSYQEMRISTSIESDNTVLEFVRRKGNKDTIVDQDGLPIVSGETELKKLLGGAAREFFARLFCLSYARLKAGGAEMLDAADDLGQVLFTAGTGLSGLRTKLHRLEEEAKGLWTSRKVNSKVYYQAVAKLEAARQRVRELRVSVDDWKQSQKKLSDAEAKIAACQERHREAAKKLKQQERIRSVHSTIRNRRQLLASIKELEAVTLLPADASKKFSACEKSSIQNIVLLENFKKRLATEGKELGEIQVEEDLVHRATEIKELNDLRIEVRRGREDLPKRKKEFTDRLASLSKLATEELGWKFSDPEQLIDRIPAKSDVERVRGLLGEHETLELKLQNSKEALTEAETALNAENVKLQALGKPVEVAELAAELTVASNHSGIRELLKTTENRIDELNVDERRLLCQLRPELPEGANLESMTVPSERTIIQHRERLQTIKRELLEVQNNVANVQNQLELDQAQLLHLAEVENVERPEVLKEARTLRDSLWELLKTRFIKKMEISVQNTEAYEPYLNNLPESYEQAVAQVDDVTERRFARAHLAGEMTALEKNIVDHQTRISQLKDAEKKSLRERERAQKEWEQAWTQSPIEKPSAPDDMLEWVKNVSAIIDLRNQLHTQCQQLVEYKRTEQEITCRVLGALKKAGVNTDNKQDGDLRVLLTRADKFRQEAETKSQRMDDLRESIRELENRISMRQKAVDEFEADRVQWRKRMKDALVKLVLENEEEPLIISERVRVLEEMREHAKTARDLRELRIAKIERDIEDYEQSATKLLTEIMPEFIREELDTSVIELDKRREIALRLLENYKKSSDSLNQIRDQVKEIEQKQTVVWADVQPYLHRIDTDDVEKLRAAIEQSDHLRQLQAQLKDFEETLEEQGNGLPIEDLETECHEVDIDNLQVEIDQTERVLEDSNNQMIELTRSEHEARAAFDAMGGSDAAAQAEADCKAALTEMRECAERYIRVQASASLLRWATDQYRKDKQGPMLKRAGKLFNTLTLNSFEKLEVDFGDKDKMILVGIRPNSEKVQISGLSSGTEDQLFLALRLAAVEDYLKTAEAIPFVADDLFINFDTDRAKAGLKVLHQLSELTQVLFYTHHSHLVELAREQLGPDVNIVELTQDGSLR